MSRASQLHALGRYSRAATPWGLLTTTAAVTIGLLLVVARWPSVMWPLHGGAIGLLAGVSAWSIDERCSAVVDVAPRPLWWRTIGRTPAALLLVSGWIATHLAMRDQLPDHLGVLVLQGASAAAAGFAAATWQRTRRRPEPGQLIALFVSPAALAIALAKPWNDHAPLFPIWPHENWPRATTIWSVAGGLSILVLAAALRRDAVGRR
jgi:hypothetical protein